MVKLDAAPMSSIFDGSFTELGAAGAVSYYHPDRSSRSDYEEKGPGIWFSDACWHRPTVSMDGMGNVVVEINRQANLEQFFAVEPGEDYRLSLYVGPTAFFSFNLLEADELEALLEDTGLSSEEIEEELQFSLSWMFRLPVENSGRTGQE